MADAGPRAIDHDPDVLFNRWHFVGTEIPVAEVILDFQSENDRSSEIYQFLDLTSDEIQAALSFAFPATRTVSVSSALMVMTVACECGEDTHRTMTEDWTGDVECVCGRIWSVVLTLVPKTGKHPGVHGMANPLL
jgi:uncharacterized protein (DUF433 family)